MERINIPTDAVNTSEVTVRETNIPAEKSKVIHEINIGNVHLGNNLVLAPMAGVTDIAYRPICKEMGAGLVCMEMVSAKAIVYNNKKTAEMLETRPEERPVSLQLFGSDPKYMAEAARRIEDLPFDILDVNMGCPVPKVVNNGEGSALMKDPVLVGKIVEALVKTVNKPVTVKIRTGFDSQHYNAPEVAYAAQESGAAAVAVHGRTREEMYSGRADWTKIREVKEKIKIPVFGNGDIESPEDVKKMYEETGCDGYLIARATRGNPWIFRDILEYFEKGKKPEPRTINEIRDMIIRHAKLEIEAKGEYIGIREMRKHIAWYTQGIPHSSDLRRQTNFIETYEDMLKVLDN
jgi:tRNA-dihydrouridine synthase B